MFNSELPRSCANIRDPVTVHSAKKHRFKSITDHILNADFNGK